MSLLFTILYTIIFFMGIHAFFSILRLKKKGFPFAGPYAGFILFWNVQIIEMFVIGYLNVGVLNITRTGSLPDAVIIWDSMIRTLASFWALYFLAKVLASLTGRPVARRIKMFFSVVLIPLSLILGIGFSLALFDSNLEWITRTQAYSVQAFLFLMLVFSVVYHQKNKALLEGSERNRAVAFSKFYATVFFVLSAIFILSLWSLLSYLLVIFLYLIMNAFPSVWHRMSLLDQEIQQEKNGYKNMMEKLKEAYGLTPREQEIGMLLLDELSIEDIRDMLFISERTVKNHIHNLYKKIGIKSREQLLDIFSRESLPDAEVPSDEKGPEEG